MLKGPLILASFGLALNVALRTVPAAVGASAMPHPLSEHAPSLAQTLQSAQRPDAAREGISDALLQLIGAESEALQVAGEGLRQPVAADLGVRANQAGAHVLAAATTYVHVVQSALDH